jgi:hypothetical protein
MKETKRKDKSRKNDEMKETKFRATNFPKGFVKNPSKRAQKKSDIFEEVGFCILQEKFYTQ